MGETARRVVVASEFEAAKQRSLWLDALERLVRNKAAMIGLTIAILVVLLALLGPYLAPQDYLRTDLSRTYERPSRDHWLGTDNIGRDMLSRIMHGGRTAVLVAAIVITISTVVGVTLGAVSAYAGRVVDDAIMRLTDITLAFPELLLAAFLSTSVRRPVIAWVAELYKRTNWEILGQSFIVDYLVVFGALAMVSWGGTARLIRGQVLSLREQDFIRAEQALGVSDWKIVRKHLIPNALSPVIISISVSVGGIMLLESSLSFLGFGIQPPGASWGNMIAQSLLRWRDYPHMVMGPGLALGIAVFGFNFLGDGINDALNPRQIRR